MFAFFFFPISLSLLTLHGWQGRAGHGRAFSLLFCLCHSFLALRCIASSTFTLFNHHTFSFVWAGVGLAWVCLAWVGSIIAIIHVHVMFYE
jgi:hypothetical protein